MHEYGITERLFQVAMDQAGLHDGERLRRLQVSLDPNSGYIPDAIRFYFEQIAKGTAAEGAELSFDIVEQPQHIRLTSIDIDDEPEVRWRISVHGAVQGVGFRPFVHNLAAGLHLCGWVRNTTRGAEMELQGTAQELHHFCHHLENDAPPLARILNVAIEERPLLPNAEVGIRILPSQPMNGRTLISPDVTTCAHCLHELFDLDDRRHRYPFINCTHCGPRFTIIDKLPYDRPETTMAKFPLCVACEGEYYDSNDRRFHAQPVACANCGPTLWFERDGRSVAEVDVALAAAKEVLVQNGIIAVKGLGGFHLACRADRAEAVQSLRKVKQRPTKPLAVMVRNVQEAARYCHLNTTEEQLLLSPEAPIVLLRKREDVSHNLAPDVSPLNAYIGMMIPYTPLHHLLLQAANMPLVMTSGNPIGEPLCIDNKEARKQLAFVGGFLLHNRPIARRCDDSVIFVSQIGNQQIMQPVRRSRGLVPLPILLPTEITLDGTLLATGADLKNVSAVAVDRQVFLSQYIGALHNPKAREEQAHALDDLERLFQIEPNAIVCDPHPDYASSRYARDRAMRENLPLIEVQHHHAHIAACMAENHRTDPVIGLSFDGTGYGSDGRIWGGEAMITDLQDFTRTCHLEYLPLPGGEAAIRQPSRITYAYWRTLLPDVDVSQFLPTLSEQERSIINTMLLRKINTPMTSSMGRLFDAVSALLGLCTRVTHEAQAAIALEEVALHSQYDGPGYGFEIDDNMVRLECCFAEVIADLYCNRPASDIARRFHHTVAEIAVAMAIHAQKATSERLTTIALSGGVWQNRLLLEMAVPLLQKAEFEVLMHHDVPANDGGIAYGQIAVAAARFR